MHQNVGMSEEAKKINPLIVLPYDQQPVQVKPGGYRVALGLLLTMAKFPTGLRGLCESVGRLDVGEICTYENQ